MSYAGLRTEDATYWAPGANNGYGGHKSFDTPVALKVRWQDHREKQIDDDGKEFVSNAIIYTDRELSKNGWLYRGTSVSASPEASAFKIVSTSRSQNPSGTIVVHKVLL